MTIGKAEVLTLRDNLVARGRTGAEVLMGLRTELYGLLELESPLPGPEAVTDAHRIEADHARASDPHFSSAHHFIQKRHATGIWQRVEALVAEAGVK